MERSKKGQKNKQRCGYLNNVEEPEYHVVDDDQEDVLNVHIQPARPLHADREYADRDLPRSSSAQSLCSNSSGNSNTPPRRPPREIPFNPGPAVNRNLKPGRTQLDERVPAVQPREQHTQLPQRSPPSITKDLMNQISGLILQKPCRRDGQKSTKNAEFSAPSTGAQSSESDSANHTNQRHSLDLDAHQIDKRSHQNLERASSKRQHHEWPQTKEDFDQHEFVPMEKPQQTYYEEDWYVGPCNRAEAEHALHLVNKDGAFLVRDCSNNTTGEPLVLAVYHDRKVYNVKIRFIESTSKYALGTGQRANDMFDSVADIVKFHSIFPIVLINGRNVSTSKFPGNCVLTCPITKKDVDQLLV
ncbi:cytokine-dependent hematopoietic cell linker-like isoform X1 [Centroberyx affinis]|uniref:cytokine-dependent hematopoietic cell linker-like isoform X1 n=1 Tax=Centroberyx affinis TaxID=166261 RepID=UPI003A5BDDF2